MIGIHVGNGNVEQPRSRIVHKVKKRDGGRTLVLYLTDGLPAGSHPIDPEGQVSTTLS